MEQTIHKLSHKEIYSQVVEGHGEYDEVDLLDKLIPADILHLPSHPMWNSFPGHFKAWAWKAIDKILDDMNKANKPKAKIIKVVIHRAEGPIDLCKRKEFNSISSAQAEIIRLNNTYPKMGYDKHDVWVYWANEMSYKFRLDCQHPENKYYRLASSNDILAHIRASVNYYTKLENSDRLEKEAKEFYTALSNECEI